MSAPAHRASRIATLLAVALVAAAPLVAAGEETGRVDDEEVERAEGPIDGVPGPFPPLGGSSAGDGMPSVWAIGGVAMIALMGLVVASSLVRGRPTPGDPLVTSPGADSDRTGTTSLWRRADEPRSAFEAGRHLAYRVAPVSLEHALGVMRVLSIGEARLIGRRPGESVVRLASCASCGEAAPKGRGFFRRRRSRGPTECAYERGFIHGAFEATLHKSVAVVETRCALQDRAGPCEFTVRHDADEGAAADPRRA